MQKECAMEKRVIVQEKNGKGVDEVDSWEKIGKWEKGIWSLSYKSFPYLLSCPALAHVSSEGSIQ